MAVVLRLSDRRARAVPRVDQPDRPVGTAEIVILPCIRRERIAVATERVEHELPTQRQA